MKSSSERFINMQPSSASPSDRSPSAPRPSIPWRLLNKPARIRRLFEFLWLDGERHARQAYLQVSANLGGPDLSAALAPVLQPGDAYYRLLEMLTATHPALRATIEELRRSFCHIFEFQYQRFTAKQDTREARRERLQRALNALRRHEADLFRVSEPACEPACEEDRVFPQGLQEASLDEQVAVLVALEESFRPRLSVTRTVLRQFNRQRWKCRALAIALLFGEWTLLTAAIQPLIPSDSLPLSWAIAAVPATLALATLTWLGHVGAEPLMTIAERRAALLQQIAEIGEVTEAKNLPELPRLSRGHRFIVFMSWCLTLCALVLGSVIAVLRSEGSGSPAAIAVSLLSLLCPILSVFASRLWKQADAALQGASAYQTPEHLTRLARFDLVRRARRRCGFALWVARGLRRRAAILKPQAEKLAIRLVCRPRLTLVLAYQTWVTAWQIVEVGVPSRNGLQRAR